MKCNRIFLSVVMMLLTCVSNVHSMGISRSRSQEGLSTIIEEDEPQEVMDLDAHDVKSAESKIRTQQATRPKIVNWYDHLGKDGINPIDFEYLRNYNAHKLRNGSIIRYPLHEAVKLGSNALVDLLCFSGANPVAVNDQGLQPLHLINRLDERNACIVARSLIVNFKKDKKRCKGFLDSTINKSKQLITFACNRKSHERLRFYFPAMQPFYKVNSDTSDDKMDENAQAAIQLKEDLERINIVNMPTRSFDMPLTLAIKAKQFELAKVLIINGAALDSELETQQPLLLALRAGNVGLVSVLLKRNAPITDAVKSEVKEIAFNVHASESHQACMEALLRTRKIQISL